jgi:hypothetical protein
MKAYRRTEAGQESSMRTVKRYNRKNPQRVKAWRSAQSHYPMMEPCEVCGSKENIDRHHDDPERELDIMFLCKLHHKARHRELEKEVV